MRNKEGEEKEDLQPPHQARRDYPRRGLVNGVGGDGRRFSSLLRRHSSPPLAIRAETGFRGMALACDPQRAEVPNWVK